MSDRFIDPRQTRAYKKAKNRDKGRNKRIIPDRKKLQREVLSREAERRTLETDHDVREKATLVTALHRQLKKDVKEVGDRKIIKYFKGVSNNYYKLMKDVKEVDFDDIEDLMESLTRLEISLKKSLVDITENVVAQILKENVSKYEF